jgi:hypothetical protein
VLKQSSLRCWRAIVGITISAACLADTYLLAGQASGESDSSALVLRLEVGQPAYDAGDTVRVRLSLRNTLSDTVKVRNGVLVDLIQLFVYDSAGQLLTPGSRNIPFFSGPPTWVLAPWAETSFKGSEGRVWSNLRDWGYELRLAGQYTIVAAPRLSIGHAPSEVLAKPAKVAVVIRRKRPSLSSILAVSIVVAGLFLVSIWARRRSVYRSRSTSRGAA